MTAPSQSNFGKWMALTAALLGWLFDGLEMGLFPLVQGPALQDLLDASSPQDPEIARWIGIITALFLVGAATGGVLFGWLGDRIGRVRAMMLSVLTYALVSGLGGFAATPWQMGALRFFAALGMGGEWSLGVALINEIWPARSRAFLAGLIGAAANVGYLTIALVGMGLSQVIADLHESLLAIGISSSIAEQLTRNQGWRLMMMFGAVPALLTFFIRLWVPESQRWLEQKRRGATSHWASVDLLGVLVGSAGACGVIVLWAISDVPLVVRIGGSLAGATVALLGYVYPVYQFLNRAEPRPSGAGLHPTLKVMILAACLSSVALLGTWGSVQQAATWANSLPNKPPLTKEWTLFWASLGAIVGTILAALLADRFGRRLTYFFLCVGSLAAIPAFFQLNTEVSATFFPLAFAMGAVTASFYGWLPLYLPELFRTSVRATGQGFGFNFGRIIASIGVLQLRPLMDLYHWTFPQVCSALSLVYVLGMILIWFAPETKGKPLPE